MPLKHQIEHTLNKLTKITPNHKYGFTLLDITRPKIIIDIINYVEDNKVFKLKIESVETFENLFPIVWALGQEPLLSKYKLSYDPSDRAITRFATNYPYKGVIQPFYLGQNHKIELRAANVKEIKPFLGAPARVDPHRLIEFPNLKQPESTPNGLSHIFT